MWGLGKLEVLLQHYGEARQTVNGLHDPLIDGDAARGEFLMFKRLVAQNKGEERDGEPHVYRAEELFTKIFGGHNRANRQIFKGRHLFCYHKNDSKITKM